ncbi:MAG: glycosyltransferase [Paracoccaceae bacterium]
MFPKDFSLKPKPVQKDPVFWKPEGYRNMRVRIALGVTVVLALVWISGFVSSIWHTEALERALREDPRSGDVVVAPLAPAQNTSPTHATITADDQASGDDHAHHTHAPRPARASHCSPEARTALTGGAERQGPRAQRLTVALPRDHHEQLLSLRDSCGLADTLMPPWYEITGENLEVERLVEAQDLQEIHEVLADLSDRSPEIMPRLRLTAGADAYGFVRRLSDLGFRGRLIGQIMRSGVLDGSSGLCLQLNGLPDQTLFAVEAFVTELRRQLVAAQKETCLTAAFESEFWRSEILRAQADRFVVTLFKEPWLGSDPGPLAAQDWFDGAAETLASTIGPEKLVVAIGTSAVDWTSGTPLPETINYSEAMSRIDAAGADVSFSNWALNSYSAFVNERGDRRQIWMLDAATTHNSLLTLKDLGVGNVAVWSLGAEDPGLWPVVLKQMRGGTGIAEDLAAVVLMDHVSYRGEGSFYRLVAEARTGERRLTQSADGKITGQAFATLPRPYAMERYGGGSAIQVALTFDDGPDREATSQVLDILKEENAPATFFAVGKPAMRSQDLLRRMVDEGHAIGSHTYFHPHIETVSRNRMVFEVNATQSLIKGATGHNTLLFRAPYIRGPGPVSGHEAAGFAFLEETNYIVAGSDIVPPDWTGIPADEIVSIVVRELNGGAGNVVLLHDGRAEGMHTIEALPVLIRTLRAQGYEIVPLATLLGTTDDYVMPKADVASSVFNFASFSFLASVESTFIVVFWFILGAGLLRSIFFLICACLRKPLRRHSRYKPPSATVVIPAYNEEEVILGSIATALAADYPGLKVIVVDDGSTDGTYQLVRDTYGDHPRVTLLRQPNQGKWKALNTAYDIIDTEVAVCVDADTQIEPDAITHLVQPFQDSRVGAVAGCVLVGNKKNMITRMQALEYFTSQAIARRALEYINGIIVVPGAFGAWRVDAVREVGLYSNETLTEDTDLTIWVLRGGYRVAYMEDAFAYTEAPSSFAAFLKQRLRWSLGMLQALWKHREAFGEEKSLRLISLTDLAVFGYIIPLLAPIVDLLLIKVLFDLIVAMSMDDFVAQSSSHTYLLVGYLAFPLIDVFLGLAAFQFSRRENIRLLLLIPFQRVFYRQMLYISVFRAMASAITGRLASWNKLKRSGITHSVQDQ